MLKKVENAIFIFRKVNFGMLKCWNDFTATRIYPVTYYQTLEQVPWHQELVKFWKLV